MSSMIRSLPRRRRVAILIVAAWAALAGAARVGAEQVPAMTPRVRQAVDRAIAYLETAEPEKRLGGAALAGRVMIVNGKHDHPLVQAAVDAIRTAINQKGRPDDAYIYSLGLSLAFLVELDPDRYRTEIQEMVLMLTQSQLPDGSWSYPLRTDGDTSMTQYAIYGLWMAKTAQITVDDDVWIRAGNWVLRTQDVGGGWGYHPRDPGTFERVRQIDVRRSMTEAAMATLVLVGEHLGHWTFRTRKPEDDVSKSLSRVKGADPSSPQPRGIAREKLSEALKHGQEWVSNTKEGLYREFPFYHLYTIERYEAFQRAAKGITGGSVTWYDAGADELLRIQAADGSWEGGEGHVPATAFAVLFLFRTTQATIHKIETLGGGMLLGGRGLPQPNVPVKPKPAASGVPGAKNELGDLLTRLDDPLFLASISQMESVPSESGALPPSELKKRLLELAQSDTPEAKAAALKALARTHDLANVPVLIEAIADPEPMVHQAAVDALRFMSRRTDEYGKPVPPEPAARVVEARAWQQWYRSIRPTGR